MESYSGKSVYPGVAFGVAILLKKSPYIIDESPAEDTVQEWERFEEAKRISEAELGVLFQKTIREIGEDEAGIIDVQRMILRDEEYIEMVRDLVMNGGSRAAFAVSKVGNHFTEVFAAMDDPYMKARTSDFADVTQRVIRTLTGGHKKIKLSEPSIVIADDLSPSEIVQMDKAMVRAFVIRQGSVNSHSTILTRTMRIPMLIQADIPLNSEINGCPAAVDAHAGKFYLTPGEQVIQKLESRQNNDKKEDTELEKLRGLPTITRDGIKINLFANISGPEDLEAILANDAEGIGVLRSEFLYLSRDNYPGEDEQYEAYSTIVKGMKGRQVTIRTLDIGADKNISYFGFLPEENPAMGLRAIRICFERPDIFRTQLRAIYRASVFGNVAIMFPMIASLWEVRRCKEAAAQVREELKNENVVPGKVPLGIMIETPAAALTADELAREVDFFSVGTNDLTQYTLAVDRENEKLSAFLDPHHPAILRLLKMIAESARKAGIWAGICGELASDLTLTEEFLKMGYSELSVSPGFILKTRQKIRSIKDGRRS